MGGMMDRAEMSAAALQVLADLMQDSDQSGAVRVAAARAVVDITQRDRDASDQLDLLDAALNDFRSVTFT